jgi:hypothetical protein
MTDVEYLNAVLRDQTFAADAPELEVLRQHKDDVERLLLETFGDANPSIKYGGSKAKGTMIKSSYDLDLICYFPADEAGAGNTLKEIYENVEAALRDAYWTESKPSAIRLRSRDAAGAHLDFHIDVVPGRYFDASQSDVWLYQNVPGRERLKTNLDVHIAHVRDSGARSPIRLMKLWRATKSVQVRNFVLELLTIRLLKGGTATTLPGQLRDVLEQFRDHSDDLCVEDPANPGGNDLSDLLNDGVKAMLRVHATNTLLEIDQQGWERVFGTITGEEDRTAALGRAAAAVPESSQKPPWGRD